MSAIVAPPRHTDASVSSNSSSLDSESLTNSSHSSNNSNSTGSGRSLLRSRFWDRLSSSIRGSDDFQDDDTIASKKLEREERERERRYQQFKKDEEFVMNLVNQALEQEQKKLAMKRENDRKREEQAKLNEQKRHEQAKEAAAQQNKRRQKKIHAFLVQDPQYLLQHVETSRRGEEEKEEEDPDELNSSSSTADTASDEEEEEQLKQPQCVFVEGEHYITVEEGYQKTICWCSSIDEELQRRKVHRVTYPTKKGGIARRVRRQMQEVTVFLEEGEATDPCEVTVSMTSREVRTLERMEDATIVNKA